MGTFLHLVRLGLVVVAGTAGLSSAHAYDCGRKYCKHMSSCAEAHHKFTVCRHRGLDRDKDSVPCENVCGKSLEIYHGRLAAEGVQREPPSDATKRGDMHDFPIPPSAPTTLTCAKKRRCGEMLSCEEARFYFKSCGVRSLDGDGNGVPCESLCRGR